MEMRDNFGQTTLIRFTRLGDGPAEAICARITAVSDADGWPSITAEQIND